jgi:hypothetical protein
VVQSFTTFWTNILSDEITVLENENLETTIAPTTTPEPPLDINVYEGCATEKVCFGQPLGCLKSKSCNLFGAVTYKDDIFTFELLSERKFSFLLISR